MRLLAKWLSVWACIGLVLMPVSTLHAHFDVDHQQVLVHGGHDHEFDHHDQFDAEHDADHETHDLSHLAVHHDSHDGWAQERHDELKFPDSVLSADIASLDHAPHHVHVVSVQSAEFDIGFKRWTPLIAISGIHNTLPPDTPALRFDSSRHDDRTIQARSHLHPPLRGPPAQLR